MPELEDLFEQLREAHSSQLINDNEELLLEEKKEDKGFIKDTKTYNQLKTNINRLSKIEGEVTSSIRQKHSNDLISDIPLEGEKLSKKEAKAQKEETSGSKWFNMPKGDLLDPKNKKDIMIIQQRAVLDPKRHYKKDKWKVSKYFQVGTIVEDKSEFYSARLKNKERQQTLLQEVLHDKESTKYFKKKYSEIQVQKSKVITYKSKKRFRR